jgi:peptidyl-prolyl cis-trans isomerase D
MLKKLRNKKTAKKVWIVLALLIVPAFVLWGSGSLMRDKQGPAYAGKIFGRNITFSEYKDAFEATRNQAIIQFGDKFPELQKYLDLESLTWQRIILLDEARKNKINAGDRQVIELIESYPFFKNSKNRFDNRIYQEILRYVFRTQPRVFEEQTRQNLILSKLYDKITSRIQIDEQELRRDYQKANGQISIFYIVANPANFTKEIALSEEEIRDYFSRQASTFKQPASFNIEYLSWVTADKDEANTKIKVENIYARLNKKDSFSKVAKDLGLESKESGLFAQDEPIPGIGWSPQISDLISRLKVGQLSSAIHADKYYYILKIKEKKESYIPDFAEVKDKVRDRLLKEKSQEMAKEKIDNCYKELNATYQINPKSVDFKEAAKKYGLGFDSTGFFKYGSYIEGIGASDSFWTAAFNLKDDQPSTVLSLPTGFYIIKVKERNPLEEKRFQAEKAEFAEKLLLQKKQEYFDKFLEDLKRKSGMEFKSN